MTVQEAYTTFEKISKQIAEVKTLYNHLKDDASKMDERQQKSQAQKLLNRITKIDVDALNTSVQALRNTVGYEDVKDATKNLEKTISTIKDYLFGLQSSDEEEVQPSEIEGIKKKYDFLQKMINNGTAENSIILKDATRLDNILSRVKYENLSEEDYDVLVDMKNYIADTVKTLKSIEKSDKYGPYLRSPLYGLIVKYVSRGDAEEAKKLTDDAIDFIESPGRIEMFEPAIKRIIAQKMTQGDFNKFYSTIESGLRRGKKFESFNSYKETNGLYII
jgi:hypothetical protein